MAFISTAERGEEMDPRTAKACMGTTDLLLRSRLIYRVTDLILIRMS